jgi:PKD repeat protein
LDGDENGTSGDDFIRNFTIGIPEPIADFEASNTNPVPDADVIFTDLTYGGPSSWTWTITPTTFSFVNGTDENSQNPEVQFADFGYYSVTLDVSNIAGSDSETKLDYINVITCVYCPAEGNDGTDEWISNVTFNTIDNSSVVGTGYTNYTSISTDVDAGSSHDISISCASVGTWTENYWVYFDWNQDCDFDDPGESYDLGETSGPGTLTTSVLVPADAVPGSVRMRTFLKYSSDPTGACENGFSYGEVEDYTVMVIDSVPPPGDCENFDALTADDYVAGQLGGMWTTWSGAPGTAEDAMVSNMYSSSPDNGFVVDAGTIDLILQLDAAPITSGQHVYSNMIYVPAGTSGYFNVQSEPSPGVAWVVELFFNDDGTGNVTENSNVNDFTYAQDIWILVEINFDLDNAGAEVLFDGVEFYQWNNTATIGSIDFFGWDVGGAPGAYYDDVCFSDEGWLVIGVEEQLILATQLYPNPATDHVNIESEYNMESVTVYNFAGQLILIEAVNSTTYRVNTSNFDAGIYLFQIETEEGRIAKRIIIE